MKLISWNVNGIRACMTKGLSAFVEEQEADIYCFQETKMQPDQAAIGWEGYTAYWNSAQKKGYSGTAVFAKVPVVNVTFGLGLPQHDTEGRVITVELADFYLVNVYTPNSQKELARLDYRMDWEDAFRDYLTYLDAQKPVIVCGDLNVAHQEIDLKNPKTNHQSAGFTDAERDKLTQLLAAGFADSFRTLYPDRTGAYSWWSYIGNARSRNAGWRIDYFLMSCRLLPRLQDSLILDQVLGSDHCPVALVLADA